MGLEGKVKGQKKGPLHTHPFSHNFATQTLQTLKMTGTQKSSMTSAIGTFLNCFQNGATTKKLQTTMYGTEQSRSVAGGIECTQCALGAGAELLSIILLPVLLSTKAPVLRSHPHLSHCTPRGDALEH